MIALAQEQLGSYVTAFGQFSKSATGSGLAWLRKLREEAFAQFAEVGFPTTHDEDWRFTNVSPIARTEFQLALRGDHFALREQIAPYWIDDSPSRIVFVNGYFAPELSSLAQFSEGIVAGSLAKQIALFPETVEPYLGRYLSTKSDPFCALNTAFLEDGAYIRVRRGATVDIPIHLLFVSAGTQAPLMCHPRNLIVVEDGAEVTLVEEYVSLGSTRVFCNAATEVVDGDGGIVSHYRIERESAETFHISTLRVHQGRDANVASHSVLLGGALVRNKVHPVLAGEGGECLINGLFLGTGHQHLDNYMLVEHTSPHCGSRQFYNGILDHQAHGVFHGRIIVHKDAQKTDAKQTNRNLLLSDDAQIDTKPQLEIFADDVKCTHGATIGQIEENALFYLRARGVDEVSARRLLLQAFASECLDRMKVGAERAYVEGLIHDRVFQIAETRERPTKVLVEREDARNGKGDR